MEPTYEELAGLTTCIVEPRDPGDAAVTCVLLHGFGASGDDLVGLAGEIEGPVRLVFPEGPIELGGLYGAARAWWLLDLARLEAELRSGKPRDRRGEIPEGLPEARAQVMQMLDELSARFDIAPDRLVLGGFSQGAMVSLDVALHRPTPPAGLLLMSGTLIAESEWQPRMAQLATVPVMMSHGRSDVLLPYHVAEALRDQLITAGAVVDWQPFSGGHEIPRAAITAANKLLAQVASR